MKAIMLSFREFSRLVPPDAGSRTIDYMTIAATSVAMYRLQQTGDPLVIVEAAGAIVTLTIAKTLAQGFELVLSRLFGLQLTKSQVARPDPASIPAGAPGDVDRRQPAEGC
jgi:hypothetical protein